MSDRGDTTAGAASPPLRELLRWLLGITRPVHGPLLASLAFRICNLTVDLALFAAAAGGAVRLVSEGGSAGPLIAVVVVLSLVKAGLFYLEQFSGHFVAFKALELLRAHVFSQMWPKAPGIVTHSRSGDILASLTRDVDRIEVVYAHSFAPIVSAYVVGPAAIVVAGIWVGWSAVWVAAACLGLSLLVVPYIGIRAAMRRTTGALAERRELAHHVSDSVFGADEVLGYGREGERLADMDELGVRVARASAGPRDLTGVRRGLNVTLSLIATASVVWLGLDSLSAAAIAALAAATLRVFEGPRGIEDATGYLDHSLAAARRLWEMSHAPQHVEDGPDVLDLAAAPAVRFESVGYRYPSADGSELPVALEGVSIDVPAGGHLVLVGRSGSGKSTLVQLLLRYDDPRDGSVTIDGEPVGRFTLDSLRHTVACVSQRNQLLNLTLAENLRLGAPGAHDDELWEALETAGLAAEVRAMPAGLDTPAGQGGSALSGGQIQRLCLARALLMRPKVLVLDEFTANLNVELERDIRRALARCAGDMTVIEVTHRLQAAEEADVVAVLDRGRLILSGPPEEVSRGVIEELFGFDGALV